MIIINGKFIQQQLTGVQRVANEIVLEIDSYNLNEDIFIITPKNKSSLKHRPKYKNIELIEVGNLNSFWEQKELFLYYLKQKSDAVLFSFSGGFPIMVSKGIYFLHDINFKVNPSFFSKKYRIYHNLIVKSLKKKNQVYIVTNSNFSKREILRHYDFPPDKITIVPLGYEHISNIIPNFDVLDKMHLKQNSFYLTVATLNKNKNLEIILKAAKYLKEEKFVVVGKRPEKKVFGNEDIFNDELITLKNVFYTGYIDNSSLAALYKSAKALIFPSFYEGFGLPALEAIYFNTPLLLSDIPVFKEIFDNIATFFNPSNPESLVKIIKNEKNHSLNSDERERILKQYTWKNCAKEILKIYFSNFK